MASEIILLVDDDSDMLEILELYLKKQGFNVFTAEDGVRALQAMEEAHPDLILLDVMMPNLDGYEFCQVIRKKTEIPILFLSSRYDDMYKILGLGIGGDDYIPKSTSMSVIIAKIKAHLRRNRMITPEAVKVPAVKEKSTLEFPGLIIKTDSADVIVNGSKVKLAAKEYQLLCLMARNPQRVYSVDHLFEVIWGENSFGDNRTVMVHLSNLRKKIETGPDTPRFIETIRGIGYKFIEMGDS